MRATLDLVHAAAVDPGTTVAHGEEQRHEPERTVGHGRLDHLPPTAVLSLVQRGEETHRQHHGATPEVADEIERHRWRRAVGAHGVERAGDGDVVEVVAALVGERAGRSPARHAPVDELCVAGQALVGADPEAFGDAGPVPLDQDVGPLDQPEEHLAALLLTEIEGERLVPAEDPQPGRDPRHRFGHRIDADDPGAHVGEQHRQQRERSDPAELHQRDAGERSATRCSHPPRPLIPSRFDAQPATGRSAGDGAMMTE